MFVRILLLVFCFFSTHSFANNPAVEAMDEILGSKDKPHTLEWCIYHNENNVRPGGCWSGNSGLSKDIMPVHILGGGLYKLREKVNEYKNKYRVASSLDQAVQVLDAVLGSSDDPHTLAWCIYHNEKNARAGGVWSGDSSLRDDIMPNHILGNGLYKLRDRINNVKQDYLPSAFRFSGTFMDIAFDTKTFNNLVQKKATPSFIVSKTVKNPKGSNATTSDSFTFEKKMQESISLTVENLHETFIERFKEFRVSTLDTTHLHAEVGASLFDLVKLGGSVDHTSSKATRSTDQTKIRETHLTKKGKTVKISSETKYQIKTTLKVKPGGHLKQDWFVNVVENINIPFEAKLLVRATRIKNGAVCGADTIKELLRKAYGVQAKEISAGSDGKSVSCKIRGKMAVSLGLDIVNNISNL